MDACSQPQVGGRNSGNTLRVLHVAAGKLFGGIESMLTTLARSRELCPPLQHEFALCFDGQLRRELELCGSLVHDLGPVRFSRPWQVWRARARLRRTIASSKSEVVVVHGAWPYAVTAPAIRRSAVSRVLWLHAPLDESSWPDRWARRFRPAAVIANSDYTAANVQDWFPGTPCVTLHCPVAPTPLLNANAVRQAVRQELETPSEAVVVLFAARMERGKGPDVLLEALTTLKAARRWTCWLAGAPGDASGQQYLAELKRLANQGGIADRLRWLGHRTDMPRLMAAADLLCQPNRSPDSFGIVFVEALSAGLPVVTSALGGALEIVDDTCGRLLPPEQPRMLAETLQALIEDGELRRRLGASGPARAKHLCDPGRQLARLHNFLSRIASPSASPLVS